MGNEELRIITSNARLSFKGSDICIGFEAETEKILNQLIGGRSNLQVISILGMPGLGKTTLAKKLYTNASVNRWFDNLSWCVVSQTYTRRSLLTKILMNIDRWFEKERILGMEEEGIAEHIYKTLFGRRYLIIMDDIWDSEVWDDLRRCIPDDCNGSRILLTSRNRDAIPHESIINVPPSLLSDQCWELLEEKVFNGGPCPPELLRIGKKIAANCRGLPHAVVVTAGILASMDQKETTWEEAAKDLDSYSFDGGNNSLMERSFQHLPEYLRPCLLYFGVFHENEQIHVRELLRFWIAEGFVGKKQGVSAEKVAEAYLVELIDKNLVMVAGRSSDGGVKTCAVHNIVRPLCLQICEGQSVQLCMSSGDDDPRRACGGSHLLEHIHSLLGRRWTSTSSVQDTRLLRTLHCGYIDSRYTGIEFLVSLKYLVIKEVPPSIGGFVNLEYLRVETDDEQVYLSSAVMKMKKLICIDVGSVAAYDKDCDTSHTNKLEYLSRIRIREPRDEKMLKCSLHLRKLKLTTCRCLDLSFLSQLESLNIRFYKIDMEGIRFPPHIKKLTLCGFESKLDSENMSTIGRLENLEVLKVNRLSFTENSWDTIEGKFQKLMFLKLDGILDLTYWNVSSSEHFPRLRRLSLRNCYNLGEIPDEIGKISSLEMIEVQGQFRESLVESAQRIQQQQLDWGYEELRIIVTDANGDQIEMKRCIDVGYVAAYDKDCDTSQKNKLEYLRIRGPHDEERLKRSPHLRKLKLSICCHVDLSFLTELESLSISFHDFVMEGISFASNIQKLTLCDYEALFDWENMSIIGRLVNLEFLKLKRFSSTGIFWGTREGEFQKLRFLKLDGINDLILWKVDSSGHFPCLRQLILRNCKLSVIPNVIGDIPTMEMIEVQGQCPESLVESAQRIQLQQQELGNEELRLVVPDAYGDQIEMKRCIDVGSVAVYDKDCDTSQTNKLEYLWIMGPHEEEMLKYSPNLRKLKLSICCHVDLSFLTQLESLSIRFHEFGMEGISFASNIQKLTLCDYEAMFDWENMSIIGRLVNLEVLKLKRFSSAGIFWGTTEGEFQKLRFLKLDGINDLILWKVDSSGHFPCLRQLILRNCYNLAAIPEEIGSIPTMEMIEAQGRCPESLVVSALMIQEQQDVLGNEELRIVLTHAYCVAAFDEL